MHTRAIPAHRNELMFSLRKNRAPRVLSTYSREVAGMMKLRLSQERTARKAKKLNVMKKMLIKKFRFVMARRTMDAMIPGRKVEISPSCFIARVINTSPAEVLRMMIASINAVFMRSPWKWIRQASRLAAAVGPYAHRHSANRFWIPTRHRPKSE